MQSTAFLALWSIAAGAGIPLIGVLNSGMARSLGSPFGATAVMFAVACGAALLLCVLTGGIGGFARIGTAPLGSYGAGLLIGFYALSATVVIPRFGAGNFIAFILVAQLGTATLVDQWGLFGMVRQPATALKIAGLLFILGGIGLMQVASRTPPAP